MDRRHERNPRYNPSYAIRIAEEEAKLRWLMTRQPHSRELAYYLIFLLAAHERYASALQECRRMIEAYPGDEIARMWRALILLRWRGSARRRILPRQFTRDRRCPRLSRDTG